MTIHVMLDLETWGKKPGCDIRSIGACVFDPVAGTVGDALHGSPRQANFETFYVATDNPIMCGQKDDRHDPGCYVYPLTRDPQTVAWWNDQSTEAQAAFANPVDLREALKRFDAWLTDLSPRTTPDRQSPHIRIWSHGAAFDPPILAAAYEACGLPVPWHYRAPRDTRTAFDMAGIADHSAHLAAHPGPLGISHHALDDAICQARAVCAAYAILREQEEDAINYRGACR